LSLSTTLEDPSSQRPVNDRLTGHERTPTATMTLHRSAIARVRSVLAMLLTYGSSRTPLCRLSTKVIRSEATRSGCSHRS
jgi:hypothetical protein